MYTKGTLMKLLIFYVVFFIEILSFSAPFDIDLRTKAPLLQVIGANAYDYVGCSLLSADIDNDGYEDIIIGAEGADVSGLTNAGIVYIVYGYDMTQSVIRLGSYSGAITEILGPKENGGLGSSLAVGDINDDYFNDIIIGAKGSDEVYIIYGSSDLYLINTIDLRSTSYPYTEIISENTGSEFGYAVACGNVNNDMYDDVIIGSPLADSESSTNVGETYIIYGKLSLPNVIQLASPTVPITVIRGAIPNSRSGFAVACGKINADYYDDVLIGAPYADTYNGANTGEVFIVLGSNDMSDFINLSEGYDHRFTGASPGDNFGYSLATGFIYGYKAQLYEEDIIIGNPGIDSTNSEYTGEVYLFYGGYLPTEKDMRYFTAYDGNTIIGADFDVDLGQKLAIGNMNADFYEDILIGDRSGVPLGRTYGGIAYIIFGRSSFPFYLYLNNRINAERAIFGEIPYDYLGDALAFGDINGDGLDEIICGATGFDKGSLLRVGKTYAISLQPPKITRAIFCDNIISNGIPDPDEQIILQFNRIIEVGEGPQFKYDYKEETQPVSIIPSDFYLTGTATFGIEASMMRNPNNPTQIVITLGPDTQGIIVPGNSTAIDIGADINHGRIYNPFTLIDAQDGGIPDENDTAIDIKYTFTPRTVSINSATGGTVGLNAGSDNIYSKHKLYIPPGALSTNENFTITNPLYPSENFVIPTGVRFIAANSKPSEINVETLNFLIPATLTVEYNPDMVDKQNGFMEKYVKIFELQEVTPGSFQWVLVPGYQSVNFSNETVEVQINSLSEGQEAQGGTGGIFGTLPVVTVDENTISIKSGGSSPIPMKLMFVESSGPLLQPGGNGTYTLHTIEFPGYVQCDPSDPLGVTIKIRQATLTERVGFENGYTYFPTQSGAVFTIETKDYLDTSVAFTAPVNMIIQYLIDPAFDRTDVVDFSDVRGDENQMRICKSTMANPPNYSFIGGNQTVNKTNNNVSINNLSYLTGSSGLCMYGVVVDRNVQPSFVSDNWNLFE